MNVSRRKLAGMLAAAVPIAVSAQTPAPTEDADLKSARDQMRNQAQQLAKVKLPMATEPPFHFKA
jgi:hypothetical protein